VYRPETLPVGTACDNQSVKIQVVINVAPNYRPQLKVKITIILNRQLLVSRKRRNGYEVKNNAKPVLEFNWRPLADNAGNS